MTTLIGIISLILSLFVVIAPFFTYYGSKRIINDKVIKNSKAYKVESISGLFPYRKRLRWIAKNYLYFPKKLQIIAYRVVVVDRLTLGALAILFAVYIITVILDK